MLAADYMIFYKNIPVLVERKENKNEHTCNRISLPRKFWDIESDFEKKIYMKMKNWEERHPIFGIIICSILGGILISLIAGIILEAMILTM